MAEFEIKLKHGIKTADQAMARFKRVRRIIGVKSSHGEPVDELVPEIKELDDFLSANQPGWKSYLIRLIRGERR